MRPWSEFNNIAGWFAGTCTNTTANITANLLLRVCGATEHRLHGELGLYGDLGGSGPFHASINERKVHFTTCLPALQTVIKWTGEYTDQKIYGTYVVECDIPDLTPAASQQQEGYWSCNFVRGQGASDAGKRDQVHVFHLGATEGPFTEPEFLQHALAGRWPPHALAAMQDRTLWGTVGECVASHQAGSAGSN